MLLHHAASRCLLTQQAGIDLRKCLSRTLLVVSNAFCTVLCMAFAAAALLTPAFLFVFACSGVRDGV